MHIFHRFPLLFTFLVFLLLVQGCAPVIKSDDVSKIRQADIALQQQVTALLATEDYAAAAQLLESNVELSDPPRRDALFLQAAEIWSKAEEWDKVEVLLKKLQTPLVADELKVRRRMLAAELAIFRHDLDLALDLMQPPPGPESLVSLRQRFHKNMAEIFRLTGNLLESARELVELDRLLQGSEEQIINQQTLVQTLSTMTDTALALLQPEPPGILGGWMDLVRIFKRQSEDPANFEAQIEAWREEFPLHPALPELLAGSITQRVLDQSSHIAILLPRSGPYAKVAAAVRDGFMSAWYQRSIENRPALRFYDSSDPERILALYQQAMQQGAQLMVGPLNKAGVSQLLNSSGLEIPILALNQVDKTNFTTNNLFQFGLAPEDEAEQIAERAWLDGHTTTVALTPSDNWGKRIYQSFRDRWESIGGRTLEHQVYDPHENDFSKPIRMLLNIDESDARKQDLQRIIGVPMESVPRRRTDAGFIFLVARSQKGRQLRPQLKFYHAGNLPVYATSHIYNSIADSEQDKDLGLIKFVDTPWLLEEDSQSELSREVLKKLIPDVRGSYARLYAMGIDAFNLLPHLHLMDKQSGPILHGKTGNLYVDGFNRIHRQLAWAEIDKGKAKITGYAPRLEKHSMGYSGERGLEAEPVQVTTPLPQISSPRPSSLR